MNAERLWAWLRPRLTDRRLLRALPVAVPLALLLFPLTRGAQGPHLPHYDAPGDLTPTTAPPTTSGDPAAISLGAVGGTTTTAAPPASGEASIAGSVVGPQGAVAGAAVRIERLVGDAVVTTDVFSQPDGTWALAGVPGGRYRIRAFLPPTLAQVEPEILFVEGDEAARADLTMEQFGVPRVVSAVAPDPPVVDELVHLSVQVVQGTVDGHGVVVHTPITGWVVEVQSAGTWVSRGPPAMFVDPSARATFLFQCRTAGPNQVQLVLRSLTSGAVVPATVAVPDCVAPAPEPTTETSVPGSSTSSTGGGVSSTSSSSTTTTTR